MHRNPPALLSRARRAFLMTAAILLPLPLSAQEPTERGILNLDELGRLPAFSHARLTGNLVFVSGTLGTRPGTTELVPGGIAAETEQTLRNIGLILERAGSGFDAVLQCTVYITDFDNFAAMNEVWISVFGATPPARATIGAHQLALGALVEVQCIAERQVGVPVPGDRDASGDSVGAVLENGVLDSGYVDSDGEQIYYEVTGEGAALVLTHGYGGNHATWYQQVPLLSQRFRVVTWDQRGFGRSTNQRGAAGPAASARDLARLLEHLGISRAHLVGQSMGGWTVTGFAVEHPQQVLSLVLADTLGGVMSAEMQADFARWMAQSASARQPESLTRHPALGDQLGQENPAQAFLYRQIGGFGPPVPDDIPRQLLETTYLDRLDAVQAPVLFVVGANDPIFPPRSIRQAAALLPGRVEEIADSGHSPYFERPDAWNHILLSFLNSLDETHERH